MSFPRSGAVALLLSSLLGMACAQPARPPAVREPALRGVQPTAASLEIQGPRLEISGATTASLVRTDKEQDVVVRVRLHGLPLAGDRALGQKVIELTKLRKTLASLALPREEALSSNGAPAPTKAMKPAAASPEEAMALRAVHGEAMKEMQGN